MAKVYKFTCAIERQTIHEKHILMRLTHFRLKHVKLSLCLIKHYPMKMCRKVEVYIHVFLTSAFDEGSALRRSCFNPRERAPGTHWTGGRVGPRAGLYTVEKWKTSAPVENRATIANPVAQSLIFHHNRTSQ
jgi:hypothetical protein